MDYTRCTGWEVREMVGHMIDVIEGYPTRWEKTRKLDECTAGVLAPYLLFALLPATVEG